MSAKLLTKAESEFTFADVNRAA